LYVKNIYVILTCSAFVGVSELFVNERARITLRFPKKFVEKTAANI